jgi:hypothetical protein
MRHYRKAFVVDPGYDFRELVPLVDEIVYLTSGFETSASKMRKAIQERLRDFDVEMDVVVPVGRVLATYIAADCLAVLSQGRVLHVALYNRQSYVIVNLHGTLEELELASPPHEEVTGANEPTASVST